MNQERAFEIAKKIDIQKMAKIIANGYLPKEMPNRDDESHIYRFERAATDLFNAGFGDINRGACAVLFSISTAILKPFKELKEKSKDFQDGYNVAIKSVSLTILKVIDELQKGGGQ